MQLASGCRWIWFADYIPALVFSELSDFLLLILSYIFLVYSFWSLVVCTKPAWLPEVREGGGVPKLQNVGIVKLRLPLFRQQQFYDPHHRYTLPPKPAKIVMESVFLNKINTPSVVILWFPTFWSSKIFLTKIYAPSIFGTPPFWRK